MAIEITELIMISFDRCDEIAVFLGGIDVKYGHKFI